MTVCGKSAVPEHKLVLPLTRPALLPTRPKAPGLTKDLIQADARGHLQNSWAFRLDEILGENTFTIVADRRDPLCLQAPKVYVDQLRPLPFLPTKIPCWAWNKR